MRKRTVIRNRLPNRLPNRFRFPSSRPNPSPTSRLRCPRPRPGRKRQRSPNRLPSPRLNQSRNLNQWLCARQNLPRQRPSQPRPLLDPSPGPRRPKPLPPGSRLQKESYQPRLPPKRRSRPKFQQSLWSRPKLLQSRRSKLCPRPRLPSPRLPGRSRSLLRGQSLPRQLSPQSRKPLASRKGSVKAVPQLLYPETTADRVVFPSATRFAPGLQRIIFHRRTMSIGGPSGQRGRTEFEW